MAHAESYCMCHTTLPLASAFHCTFVYKYQNVNTKRKKKAVKNFDYNETYEIFHLLEEQD